ncbi:MAG: DsrE family protein [Burkholderiales bacterium]|nr:DsrE family protein [Burkholderiales bacterium]
MGRIPFLLLALFLPLALWAADHPVVARLLAAERAPAGVVFEIVTADSHALAWAVPWVAEQARRLRGRFPGLPIAVVSHGREMFALTGEQRTAQPELHAGVQKLVQEEGIALHVCETHAGWRGVAAEAFPEYVNVSAAGPVQVQDYLALGYVLVKITARDRGLAPADGLK